jgi:hypothetical protein
MKRLNDFVEPTPFRKSTMWTLVKSDVERGVVIA